jgi:hypothetical protein
MRKRKTRRTEKHSRRNKQANRTRLAKWKKARRNNHTVGKPFLEWCDVSRAHVTVLCVSVPI